MKINLTSHTFKIRNNIYMKKKRKKENKNIICQRFTNKSFFLSFSFSLKFAFECNLYSMTMIKLT